MKQQQNTNNNSKTQQNNLQKQTIQDCTEYKTKEKPTKQ